MLSRIPPPTQFLPRDKTLLNLKYDPCLISAGSAELKSLFEKRLPQTLISLGQELYLQECCAGKNKSQWCKDKNLPEPPKIEFKGNEELYTNKADLPPYLQNIFRWYMEERELNRYATQPKDIKIAQSDRTIERLDAELEPLKQALKATPRNATLQTQIAKLEDMKNLAELWKDYVEKSHAVKRFHDFFCTIR